MRKRSIQITKTEFSKWLNRRGKYREFSLRQYASDLENWKNERGDRVLDIDEYCYIISLGKNYCLKIYSSVDKETKVSRERGEDSIKIVVANEATLFPERQRLKHTERILGWGNNLDETVIEGLEALWGKSVIKCTKCRGGKLIIKRRISDGVTFLGCTKYSHESKDHDSSSLDSIWSKANRNHAQVASSESYRI